jgi:histone deacetylase 6
MSLTCFVKSATKPAVAFPLKESTPKKKLGIGSKFTPPPSIPKYTLNIKDVEKHFELSECYFEEESTRGTTLLTDLFFQPNATYVVSGKKNLKKQKKSKTGLVYDENMMLHHQQNTHPEKPQRIKEIWNFLEEEGLVARCERVQSRRATDEEILHVHTQNLLDEVKNTPPTEYGDCYFNQHTDNAAHLSCGCVIELCDQVMQGKVENGFAVVRPPGHHCSHKPSGFCFYNNVAVAVKVIQKKYALERVLIVDWDVHHGNGTQELFENDPSVLFLSTHFGFDFYPGTGKVTEIGQGAGKGYTVNVSFDKAEYGDGEMLAVFHQILLPIAREFDPQFVIVSSGFDAVYGDPLGGCNLSPQVYGHMTYLLKSLAGGKLVLALEGGYNLREISRCTYECVKVLAGDLPSDLPKTLGKDFKNEYWRVGEKHVATIRDAIKNLAPYWQSLSFASALIGIKAEETGELEKSLNNMSIQED